jgi:hypothetical protein
MYCLCQLFHPSWGADMAPVAPPQFAARLSWMKRGGHQSTHKEGNSWHETIIYGKPWNFLAYILFYLRRDARP